MADDDSWDGNEYLSRPGARDTGRINAATVMKAVEAAGYTPEQIKTLNALEVGAGVGTVTPHLGFGSVYAIEPSPSMAAVLAWMIRDVPNASYGIHELTPDSAAQFEAGTPIPSPTKEDPNRAVPPPHAKFDVAFCTLVAHHVSDLPTFFKGVLGVLKPGGLFIVLEFRHGDDGEDLSVKYHLLLKPDMEAVNDDAAPITGKQFRVTWTPDQMAAKFKEYGFVDIGSVKGDPVPAFGDPEKPKEQQHPGVPTMAVWGRRPQ